jgi:heat shock protein HslJ
MKKLLFAAACALAITGCAEMAQQDKQAGQQSEQRFREDDAPTGSMIARKKPKAPAETQAGASGNAGNSAPR